MVALALGALRSIVTKDQNGCILTTDLESAMPLLEHNVSANEALFSGPSTRPRPIVMADVTYNTASFPSLIRMLSALVRLSPPSKPPVIVLGYKERDQAERTLWDMAEEIGVAFKKVGGRAGAGGRAIEAWIGLCQRL
ncbi:hypothetical protein C8Q78DRAFT_267729 [Trametes maxima]|nr:hypothetical protein C8Q78DRAFT_267729 [Trametes maxima]